ncbi:MAG: arginine--tRNA ligase [Candidatus Woesearchaeota archaeon]
MDEFKLHIIEKIVDELGSEGVDERSLEIPPDPAMGDYAFPCFMFSKRLKKSPQQIAEYLTGKIVPDDMIAEVRSKGPYLNFFVNKSKLAEQILKEVAEKKERYGTSSAGKNQRVIIEFPSPNTNKPLHLGHLRNMALGESMANIIESQGYDLNRVNLNNDRGIHICKSMLAYQRWGEDKTPESEGRKSDHFVGDYYVLYNEKEKEDPSLTEDAHEMLRKWEASDKDIRSLWKKMNTWAFDGFEETYKTFGLPAFDKVYYESNTYMKGKEVVMSGLDKGVFTKREDGAISIDLSEEGLGEKVLMRSDGTSVYVTQDLYLAQLKHDDFSYDKSIYVVASEQNYHFKVLFTLLKKLGHDFADGCYHFSYGMVLLPEGKMKSREGTVVDADDMMLEMQELARGEITKRYNDLEEQEIHDRSVVIGLGALKFYLLATDSVKDMTFHKEQSISFEGETGPYVQYAHARICSIFRKYGKPVSSAVDFGLLKEDVEKEVIKKIQEFPLAVSAAAEHYRPSIITRHLLDLGQLFSSFYNACPVLKAENEEILKARLFLCDCVRQVLANGLHLLGIKAPEEM